MELSNESNVQEIVASVTPIFFPPDSNLQNTQRDNRTPDTHLQAGGGENHPKDVDTNAKAAVNTVNSEQAKKQEEEKVEKEPLKEQNVESRPSEPVEPRHLAFPETGNDKEGVKGRTENEEERMARKARRKEEKRALKAARKLEKQQEKENTKGKKRQRSPSPSIRADSGASGEKERDGLHDRSEKREKKKKKLEKKKQEPENAADAGEAAGMDGGDKKRKREVDKADSQLDTSLPSAAVDTHPIRESKKQKPLTSSDFSSSVPALNPPAGILDAHTQATPLPAQPHPTPALPSQPTNMSYPHKAAVISANDVLLPYLDANVPSSSSDTPLAPHDSRSARTHTADTSDQYGIPVCLPQAHTGFYATFYYPHRTVPFQVPTGQLSKRARKERYKGLTEEKIAEREAGYELLSKECPKVFQEAFKHTARGRLDKIAHHWLVPRVKNYYFTHPDSRSSLLDRIVRDLIHEFPDLHPNFLKLKDSSMEKEYLGSLRNMVSVATSGVKSALENPTKVENIDKEVVKHLSGAMVPSRPHDLWAKSILDGIKEEVNEVTGDAGSDQGRSDDSPNLAEEWEATYNEFVKVHGKRHASRHRLKLEQEFRKENFDKLPAAEKQMWEDLAATSEKPVDPMTALTAGLPYINLVNKRFCELAQVPMVVLLGAPDYQNPGKVLVYHDTYSPAPSQVLDFFNGPDRFGETVILPAFRRFLAQCYNAPAESVAVKGAPLPTPPEPSEGAPLEDEIHTVRQGGPTPSSGVVARSGVRFVVTPPPLSWTVPSREQEAIRKNVKAFIGDSFKKAHNKQRCHFSTIASRAADFINLSFLPTSKTVLTLEADGFTTRLEEGELAQIIYPIDPSSMTWYQLKAWYDLLKNPDSKFVWRAEESTASANIVNLPTSVKESLQAHNLVDHLANGKSKQIKKGKSRAKATATSSNDAHPPLTGPSSTSVPPVKSRGRQKEKSSPGSEDEAISSDEESVAGSFTAGSESSCGEGYRPDAEYVLRSETISRSGRRSVPPKGLLVTTSAAENTDVVPPVLGHPQVDDNETGGPGAKSGDTVQLPPVPLRPRTSLSSKDSLIFSPEKNSSNRSNMDLTEAQHVYVLRPPTEPEVAAEPGQLDPMLEHVRDLSHPKLLRDAANSLPNLQTALKHCTTLDALFPAREPMSFSWPAVEGPEDGSNALNLFWRNLNDPEKPIPTCLAATRLAAKAGTTVAAIAGEVEAALAARVEILEGHDMLEDSQSGLSSFVSWTKYLVLLSRYLKFMQSVEPPERVEGSEDLSLLYERVFELTIIHLVIRYCVSAMTAHITNYPAPSASPTIANTVSTLGSAWIRLVKRLCNPINKLRLSEVYGVNWAEEIDSSTVPAQIRPFFHLSTPAQRWITVKPSQTLYDAILDMEKELHSDPSLLDEMSVYEQITFLASMFAVHNDEKTRGSDDEWLGVVDKVLEVIELFQSGGGGHETEQNPNQPPPTLISSAQSDPAISKHSRPRPSASRVKTAWAVGDIAKVTIEGEEREVIFVYKQKYGLGTSRYLVMADPSTRKEIFAPDGESELGLPPFSPRSLVLAGYVAQFTDFPDEDDDPNVLEKRGFKPPQFFINKHRAKATATVPEPSASPLEQEAVANVSQQKDAALTPTSPQQQSSLAPSTNVISNPAKSSESVPCGSGGDVAIPPDGIQSGSAAAKGPELSDEAPNGDGNDKNAQLEGQEETEEEEVENVLSPKRKVRTAAKDVDAKAKGPRKKSTVSKPSRGTETTKKKKDHGLPQRASARLRRADADVMETTNESPSQPPRRVSLRKKQDLTTATSLTNPASGRETRSQKK